jgi:ubiquinone biosynthesis protein
VKLAWLNLARLGHLFAVLVRHGVTWGLEWTAQRRRAPRWLAARVRRLRAAGLSGPERLRSLLEDMGGTFVKFGQMLALQPDIISIEYCNALFNLLDRVAPFPYAEVERIWREDVGRPLEEVFESFEREPVATASVGQVHVARYRGEKVAVKVQRPNVELQFGSDIRIMLAAVGMIRLLRIRYLEWLVEPLTEFIGWTREEIDYRFEARYGERVRQYAVNNPVQVVPRVYQELTTRRTLVAGFLEGATLVSYLRAREDGDEVKIRRLEPAGFDRKRFAANVIDNFLGDAFRNGIYHADLHPANLLLLEGSVVGYIDFGITGVMSRHGRRHLVVMTLALAEGDMDRLYESFREIAAYNPEAAPEAFRKGLDALAEDWYEEEGGARRMKVNFTRIMGDMLTLSRKTGLLPERDIVKYIRSAIAIDGLVTRFEPDFDVGDYLVEACSRFLAWQGRRERFAPDKLLDAAGAGGKLWRDAPERGSKVLDRLVAGELPASVPPAEADGGGLAGRALQLGAVMLAVALLTAASGAPLLGLNLWTVEVGLVAAAGAMLLRTVARLA